MKVPFRLAAQKDVAPTAALLYTSWRTVALLTFCAQLGIDPLPRIFRTADGFLLYPPDVLPCAPAGAIHLRALTANLLLPVDATLIPPLLDDEAAALVKERGLIFLPGQRVLEYDPQQPLTLAEILSFPPRQRSHWQPLPSPAVLADRVRAMRWEIVQLAPDDVLDQGQGDIGTESPQPPDTGPSSKVMGQVNLSIGKGLAWLGEKLNSKELSQAGANMIAGAMKMAPKLGESVLGKQDAMLRSLLEKFRQGKTDEALRNALPLGGEAHRGSTAAQNAMLPINNLFYSLGNILGNSGPASVWFGGSDEIYRQLEQKYRDAAAAAVDRGDYRRAAFIHGKLLGDFRAAANVLMSGGLFRDAAIIYLKKLNDTRSAAKAFESAGEFDEALQLYRRDGAHLEAAELLRRLGEEDQAVAEFQMAAQKLIATRNSYFDAAELLRTKAGRADLALPLYEQGWDRRPLGEYLRCAERIMELTQNSDTNERITTLVDEADEFFDRRGSAGAAAQFYNTLAYFVEQPAMAHLRDDLRDRALVGLAQKIRRQATSAAPANRIVSGLLRPSNWNAATISDAQFALKTARQCPSSNIRRDGPAKTLIRAKTQTVTAVTHAPETELVFIGYASGEVVRFDPRDGDVMTITKEKKAVLSLACNCRGDNLVVLSQKRNDTGILSSYTHQSGYRMVYSQLAKANGALWLSPTLAGAGPNSDPEVAALWNGRELQFLAAVSLLPLAHWQRANAEDAPIAVFLAPGPAHELDVAVTEIRAMAARYYSSFRNEREYIDVYLPIQPILPRAGSLQHPQIAWIGQGREDAAIAGLVTENRMSWSHLYWQGPDESHTRVESAHGPYLAVTLVRPGLIAAVTNSTIYWMRPGPKEFRIVDSLEMSLSSVVACFPNTSGSSLIVVCNDGVVQVPQRYN